ncbi:putative phage-like DNA-binding protein [Methylophaga frappieri]|uniref:Putative phage-like DNA-binding protein n=1 Tax=Methylophaga frappieri (strain ATCC BAA-2434 / DSM 25690 / JAM7) TaxID=754477 RepID=I1YGE5_METFJ|nr:DNA-binding protein [Methylophaga frappieri]AFJ01988.1 putative phage-like DNA-binding protein [Methylophaga frappieri]
MSPEQVKAKFKKQGLTFSKWARENEFPVRAVYRVIAGIDKGDHGRAHEIAVKLGIKADPEKPNSIN